MSGNAPKLSPFPDWNEWIHIKNSFASSSIELKMEALEVVHMWRLRGRLPHSVDITSQLEEVMIKDDGSRTEMELKLLYSIVVIRAVNGLVDPNQQSMFAGSVMTLADNIGIPGWVVDLRHQSTHNVLPSLSCLRSASRFLYNWYFTNYWEPQYQVLRSLSNICFPEGIGGGGNDSSSTSTSSSSTSAHNINNNNYNRSNDRSNNINSSISSAGSSSVPPKNEQEFRQYLQDSSPTFITNLMIPLFVSINIKAGVPPSFGDLKSHSTSFSLLFNLQKVDWWPRLQLVIDSCPAYVVIHPLLCFILEAIKACKGPDMMGSLFTATAIANSSSSSSSMGGGGRGGTEAELMWMLELSCSWTELVTEYYQEKMRRRRAAGGNVGGMSSVALEGGNSNSNNNDRGGGADTPGNGYKIGTPSSSSSSSSGGYGNTTTTVNIGGADTGGWDSNHTSWNQALSINHKRLYFPFVNALMQQLLSQNWTFSTKQVFNKLVRTIANFYDVDMTMYGSGGSSGSGRRVGIGGGSVSSKRNVGELYGFIEEGSNKSSINSSSGAAAGKSVSSKALAILARHKSNKAVSTVTTTTTTTATPTTANIANTTTSCAGGDTGGGSISYSVCPLQEECGGAGRVGLRGEAREETEQQQQQQRGIMLCTNYPTWPLGHCPGRSYTDALYDLVDIL